MKWAIALLVVTLLWVEVGGNVLGIDFGSDSMKVAIIQPGKALEIVTNFQSKRKTPTSIAFYKGERFFGSDATALMGRKPDLSFEKVFRAIGRDVNHPLVKEIVEQYHPYNIYKNESSGLTTIKVEQATYTPEELIAMILQYVKDMTNNFGGHTIKDCVITVPSYFTQHEKEALFTAAQIADLKVLSLIEENTAAALHYAMDNTFDQPTNILYYNMGAGSVQVSIVSYSSHPVKEGGKNKTVGHFEVVGKSWDASLGGFNFDLKLADLLAARFNEVWQKKPSGKDKDLRNFIRPMTRLRIEANKVKEVLSANMEYPIRAEQLHADVDLVTKVTRSDFETACSELFDRVSEPIQKALSMANLTIDDIHQVELLGGGVRIPKVKKIIDEYFHQNGNKKVTVGQHLNGDEAMALGAAFRAANLSTAFRVRKVGMSDVSSFGVAVRMESQENGIEESENKWHKYTNLFQPKSAVPSKQKTVAFHYDQDIFCKVEYDEASFTGTVPTGTDKVIGAFNITGISTFAKEYAVKSKSLPKVHLSFTLDNSGVINLVKAEATVELEEETTETGKVEPESLSPLNETDINAANATSTEQNSTSTNPSLKKKAIQVRRHLVVSPMLEGMNPPRWTLDQIQEAKNKLESLQIADKLRKAKEAALNDLEGYIYNVKNRISDEENALKAVSTEEQRQKVVDLANEVEEWLYDDGRDQTVEVYKGKQKDIENLAQPIFHRFKEVSARTAAIEKARKSLDSMKTAVLGWEESRPQISVEEREKMLKQIKAVDDWIEEKAEQQDKQSPFENPVFESAEVLKQLKPVSSTYEKLLKKPKPVPPVVEKNTTIDTEVPLNSNSTTSDESIKVEVEQDKSEPTKAEL